MNDSINGDILTTTTITISSDNYEKLVKLKLELRKRERDDGERITMDYVLTYLMTNQKPRELADG